MYDKDHLFIETDILAAHLTHRGDGKSILELALTKAICFTSVINASELYFAAQNEIEKTAVDKLLRNIKVLGLHARYSLSINEFADKTGNVRDSLICVLVKNSKLPVLTNYHKKYKFTGIVLIDPESLRG